MAMNHYTGTRAGNNGGFVQGQVFDMMGQAQPGSLVHASDMNLCDSMASMEDGADGLVAGLGCVELPVTALVRGINTKAVRAPIATDGADAFAGVVVRTAQMGSNAKGQPALDRGEMATVLRNARSGGRVWVVCARGNAVAGGDVYMVVNPADSEVLPHGSFVTAAESGDAVKIQGARWIDASGAGQLNAIEFLG